MNLDSIISRYREKGIKITPQRLAVLKSLEGDTSHPSALDIYKRLKKTFPSLSLTTVYNTLEVLKDIGEVAELDFYPERSLFDPNVDPHDHIYCIRCGRVDDLAKSKPAKTSIEEAQKKGYRIINAIISFSGICEGCQEKS